MTDAMLVALVGIGGVVLGTSVGAIGGFLNTKLQMRSRVTELRLQFEHEVQDKIIERRIDIRSSYLSPIREKLTSIATSSHLIEKKLSELRKLTREW